MVRSTDTERLSKYWVLENNPTEKRRPRASFHFYNITKKFGFSLGFRAITTQQQHN